MTFVELAQAIDQAKARLAEMEQNIVLNKKALDDLRIKQEAQMAEANHANDVLIKTYNGANQELHVMYAQLSGMMGIEIGQVKPTVPSSSELKSLFLEGQKQWRKT